MKDEDDVTTRIIEFPETYKLIYLSGVIGVYAPSDYMCPMQVREPFPPYKSIQVDSRQFKIPIDIWNEFIVSHALEVKDLNVLNNRIRKMILSIKWISAIPDFDNYDDISTMTRIVDAIREHLTEYENVHCMDGVEGIDDRQRQVRRFYARIHRESQLSTLISVYCYPVCAMIDTLIAGTTRMGFLTSVYQHCMSFATLEKHRSIVAGIFGFGPIYSVDQTLQKKLFWYLISRLDAWKWTSRFLSIAVRNMIGVDIYGLLQCAKIGYMMTQVVLQKEQAHKATTYLKRRSTALWKMDALHPYHAVVPPLTGDIGT